MAPFPKWLRMKKGASVGWKCEDCGRRFSQGWMLEFHHVLPQNAGGEDTEENCVCLCMFCHLARHLVLRAKGLDHPRSADLIQARINRTGGRTDQWLKANGHI